MREVAQHHHRLLQAAATSRVSSVRTPSAAGASCHSRHDAVGRRREGKPGPFGSAAAHREAMMAMPGASSSKATPCGLFVHASAVTEPLLRNRRPRSQSLQAFEGRGSLLSYIRREVEASSLGRRR